MFEMFEEKDFGELNLSDETCTRILNYHVSC